MKVSIRPPVVTADSQCFDDDRFNIKFVSHFVDIPDNQEADETQCEKDTKDDLKDGKKKKDSGGSKDKKSSFSTAQSSKSRSSQRSVRPSLSKDSKNINKSSRPDRNWSTSTSEQSSEAENSYDYRYMNDRRGMSNSNRRRSKNWYGFSSSNDDEESSQSTQPMSSSNDDDEDQENFLNILTDVDSEQSDEQEIVMLYGQIRQIIRGPTVNEPGDVQPLPAAEVVDAEEDKETLSPSTVVTESPLIVEPVEASKQDADDKQYDTATVSLHDNGGKKDGGGSLTPSVRSEAARRAGTAASARAAKMKPYKTKSDDHYRRCLPSKTSTNDVIATPWSSSAPQMPEIRDSESVDNVSETSSTDDAALVVARRTTPLYGRGSSPWLTDQSDPRNGPTAAAAAVKINELASSSSPNLPSPPHQSQQLLQQQKHHAPEKHCRRDSTTHLSRRPRPDMEKIRSELEYLMAPPVTANFPLEAAVDQSERNIIVAHVTTESPILPPPVLRRKPPDSAPRRQLASCLKYHSTARPSSTSQAAANPQRQRRIHFASQVKQRTYI